MKMCADTHIHMHASTHTHTHRPLFQTNILIQQYIKRKQICFKYS